MGCTFMLRFAITLKIKPHCKVNCLDFHFQKVACKKMFLLFLSSNSCLAAKIASSETGPRAKMGCKLFGDSRKTPVKDFFNQSEKSRVHLCLFNINYKSLLSHFWLLLKLARPVWASAPVHCQQERSHTEREKESPPTHSNPRHKEKNTNNTFYCIRLFSFHGFNLFYFFAP